MADRHIFPSPVFDKILPLAVQQLDGALLQHAFRCTFILFSYALFLCLASIRLLKLSLLQWKAMFTFNVRITSHALQPGILRPTFGNFFYTKATGYLCLLCCVWPLFLSHVSAVYQWCFDKTWTLRGILAIKWSNETWSCQLGCRVASSSNWSRNLI